MALWWHVTLYTTIHRAHHCLLKLHQVLRVQITQMSILESILISLHPLWRGTCGPATKELLVLSLAYSHGLRKLLQLLMLILAVVKCLVLAWCTLSIFWSMFVLACFPKLASIVRLATAWFSIGIFANGLVQSNRIGVMHDTGVFPNGSCKLVLIFRTELLSTHLHGFRKFFGLYKPYQQNKFNI